MFKEKNTGTNLPAQIDISAETGDEYKFLFVAKGGGSANKSFLFQQTPAILNEPDLMKFIGAKVKEFGTAACPPYHVAIVVGGDQCRGVLEDGKARVGRLSGPFADQRLARAGARFEMSSWRKRSLSNPTAAGSARSSAASTWLTTFGSSACPATRELSHRLWRFMLGRSKHQGARSRRTGVFLEQLEFHPEQYLPAEAPKLAPPVKVDLNIGMDRVRQILTKFPVKTRLELTGTLIVARDAAHARIKQTLDAGQPMPQYFKDHPIYYAGPAKTPEGMPSGSFGPTTAGRMDSFVDLFQSHGGSMVMMAKGNRSKAVTEACKKHGGFYLGSIGGPAAILAQSNIRKVELVDFEDLGMEAIRKIEVVDFPAFIVVDDKGNDFFEQL
jgi:fumarate hydratase class I